jgi:hypothetical protein
MATILEKTLKRELMIEGRAFMLSISPAGLLLTVKGRRKGLEIEWADLVSGDAALATALNASLHSTLEPSNNHERRKSTPRRNGNGSVKSRRR